MTERPILFSPPMVKAILEGRKTQTRRVLRIQPSAAPSLEIGDDPLTKERICFAIWDGGRSDAACLCPFGPPGDRLWVRERHCYLDVIKSHLSQFPLGPQNDNEVGPDIWNVHVEYSDGVEHEKSVEGDKPKQTRERGESKWRPGIFMHRWASRLTLEVTRVCVNRLQEINQVDALAEGTQGKHSYAELWGSLNAKRGFGWDKNPWVWVVEFKRV